MGDDQRAYLTDWVKVVLNDTDAAKYISGIGLHWYTDIISSVDNLDVVHDMYPDMFMMGTEACAGAIIIFPNHVDLGNWERGQRYSIDVLNDLNHWVVGWTDWNLALDLQGGPNWAENFVEAPIIVNADSDEFYKQPIFYHFGHFSKFIPEGSRRIRVQLPRFQESRTLKYAAFLHDDQQHITLVVLNQDAEDVLTSITDINVGQVDVTIPKDSIQTFIWRTSDLSR